METNKIIIDVFTKLIKQTEEDCYNLKESGKKKEATACQFKVKNYIKGLDIIKGFPEPITQPSQLKDIKGIGKGILSRIEEILETQTLVELKGTHSLVDELTKLQRITGVGPKSAHNLLNKKLTLEVLLDEISKIPPALKKKDIRNISIENIIETSPKLGLHLHELTHHQLVGLKYFADIDERIPRSEMVKIESKIKDHINKIDPQLIVTICGSYRRNRPNSGDIDILITHPNLATEEDINLGGGECLILIIDKLTESKLLSDHLTSLGTTKYMGVCRLTSKSKGRRIDIRFVARNDYAPALLYFTGSKNFNQRMRGEALKLGYTINEYGIYRLLKKNGKFIHKKGKKIIVQTEKDIFDLVGMDYLEPHERD